MTAEEKNRFMELINLKNMRIEVLETKIKQMMCCGNCINHNDLCYCKLNRKEVNASDVCNKWKWEKE